MSTSKEGQTTILRIFFFKKKLNFPSSQEKHDTYRYVSMKKVPEIKLWREDKERTEGRKGGCLEKQGLQKPGQPEALQSSRK